jgi:hypothetical protein
LADNNAQAKGPARVDSEAKETNVSAGSPTDDTNERASAKSDGDAWVDGRLVGAALGAANNCNGVTLTAEVGVIENRWQRAQEKDRDAFIQAKEIVLWAWKCLPPIAGLSCEQEI